ncbi:LacI family transcriptional regulator [Paenibacillus sp. N1-5-1-14]|uniref:LacI family DNA-binding transcriptional regulator n=1 Tax=Paenibacillus radicibacter TaxID=2972488 RepID=UPI002158C79D|nr:LacI family DNA-binding transcriptional regulator [Paenibacillus radicibacter]MCR8642696.1 LacI family transcriptional regulator [Paenibacillus radicibacter]
MTRLKDIAERAGVSISTASRAISGDTSRPVSEDTKQKVRQIALELGYEITESPVKSSKSIPKKNANLLQIACIGPQHLIYNHPYFTRVFDGIHHKMKEMGLPAPIIRTSEEVDDAAKMKALVQEHDIQGVLAVSWYDESLYQVLRKENVHVLGVSINDDKLNVPVVDCDRVYASRAGVRHLIDQGHTRIGFIGGPSFSKTMDSEERFVGYKFAMLDADLRINPSWMINSQWNVNRSYRKMGDMLKNLPRNEWPTAMFCASDMLAIPAMRAALEQECRIPDDLAFMGMDNIEMAQYTTPPLTSVQVPRFEIGMMAAKSIVDYLEGHYPAPPKILLPCSIIVRESSLYSRLVTTG